MRIVYHAGDNGGSFEIDGDVLTDGEATEVDEARGEALLARFPDLLSTEAEKAPVRPAVPVPAARPAQAASATAPADQKEAATSS